MFLVFIPLFLALLTVVFWMDAQLHMMAYPEAKEFYWRLEKPDFGLQVRRHTGFTSHMRAIQVNPRAVAQHRTRPNIARAFPVKKVIRRGTCLQCERGIIPLNQANICEACVLEAMIGDNNA